MRPAPLVVLKLETDLSIDKENKPFDLVYCELPLHLGVILTTEAAPMPAQLLHMLRIL